MDTEKQCSICGVTKPLTEFNKGKGKFGKRSNCKACQKQSKKEWAEKNKQSIYEYNKKYKREHPEQVKESDRKSRIKNHEYRINYNKEYRVTHVVEIKASSREYYLNNHERLIMKQRDYRANNIEADNKRSRDYRENHRFVFAQYGKDYRAKNADKLKQYSQDWYRKNKTYARIRGKEWRNNNIDRARLNGRVQAARRRAKKLKSGGSHTVQQIQAKYIEQQGLCHWCKCELNGIYDVDHVKPISKGGSDNIENIVLSCPSCNRSRRDKLPDEWLGS